MIEEEETAWLVVPARPEYLRFARITGAGLATRIGFSYDDLEDLRLAVDEICFALLPGSPPPSAKAPPPSASPAAPSASPAPPSINEPDPADAVPAEPVLELRYSTTATAIEVEGALRGGHKPRVALSDLGRRILAAVVDEYMVCPDTGRGESILIRKAAPEAAHSAEAGA